MNDGEVLLTMAVGGGLLVLTLAVFVSVRRGGGGGSGAPKWRPEFGDNGTPDRPFQPTISSPGIALDAEHGCPGRNHRRRRCVG